MGLIDSVGPGPIAIDTAPFIYLIEEHPRFLAQLLPVFEAADAGAVTLVTSAITLLEVLVVPLRSGNTRLAARYEALITGSRGVRVIDVDRVQLRTAAQLRARTGMRTPDALQVAAALTTGCRTFVTNDRRLPAVPGVTVLQVADFC